MKICVYLILILFFAGYCCKAQSTDSLALSVQELPARYYSKVDNKISSVDKQLTKKSIKYLAKFQKQEAELQLKMQKLHPELMISDAKGEYDALSQKIKSKVSSFGGDLEGASGGEYNSYLDSLGTSLSFLKKFDGTGNKLQDPLKNFDKLEDKLQHLYIVIALKIKVIVQKDEAFLG